LGLTGSLDKPRALPTTPPIVPPQRDIVETVPSLSIGTAPPAQLTRKKLAMRTWQEGVGA